MNVNERKLAVFCMEYLARQINDEDVFDLWLTVGVADGDISYPDFSLFTDDFIIPVESIDDYYIEDDNFAYLMKVFLSAMSKAKKSGGLYCDNVTSD